MMLQKSKSLMSIIVCLLAFIAISVGGRTAYASEVGDQIPGTDAFIWQEEGSTLSRTANPRFGATVSNGTDFMTILNFVHTGVLPNDFIIELREDFNATGLPANITIQQGIAVTIQGNHVTLQNNRFVVNGSLDLVSVHLIGNGIGTGSSNGGPHVGATGTLNIREGTIIERFSNGVDVWNGGTLNLQDSGLPTVIRDNIFSGITCSFFGTITIDNVIIENNGSSGISFGSNTSTPNTSILTMNGGIIQNNGNAGVGVNSQATFNFNGGIIQFNEIGVFINPQATFNWSGGMIGNNRVNIRW